MFLGTMGANFAGKPLAHMVVTMGWRSTLLVIGALGFGLCVLLYIFIRDPKKQTTDEQPFSFAGVVDDFVGIVCSLRVWLIALFGMLMYVPLAALADLWGPSMLMHKMNIDLEDAGFLIAFIYIGVAVGSPVMMGMADVLRSRKTPMLIGVLLSLSMYSLIIFAGSIPYGVMLVLLFLAGFSFGGQNMVFASISESLPLKINGLGLGFINMVVMCSGVIFQPLVGYLLNYTSRDHQPDFTVADFQFALIPVMGGLLVGLVIWIWIKETYPVATK